ncbi:MAG: DUF47 domain-containing protein [Rubrivivax sp.]|jgi:predicted phosphate transport protein (TIGR00153 family)|nr:DUF47 domain-containing protein [Rubrivivax sp.]
MVFAKLLPKDGNFFDRFNEHGTHIAEGAAAFMRMVKHYDDPALREKYAAEVDAAERAADRVTHEVSRMLHRTFITPIDREQILSLINAMDDVLDLLEDCTEVMTLYDVQRIDEDVARLAVLSVRCCELVQHAVTLLPKLSSAQVVEDAIRTCEEIDRLEGQADRALRSALSRLFREEQDTRELIKLKAVYEHLELISDRCEDVANLIEGVVLENS